MAEHSIEEALARDARAVSGEEPYEVLYSIEFIDGEMVSTAHYHLPMLEEAFALNEAHHG